MLAVSPLRNTRNDENKGKMESFSIISSEEFPDFAEGNLLESIDFDDLFIGIDEGDMLPDLEMDPEILADLPTSRCDVEESMNTSVEKTDEDSSQRKEEEEEEDKISGSGSGSSSSKGEEIFSKREEPNAVDKTPSKYAVKGRKSSAAQAKNNNQGKRKTKKVDWTPELHRRFVQAVEQLGVDKAVPSRILELMGIDCLTRHNIASHLQKYRSHRKHLLAREAEAANWTQRRQMYGGAATPAGGGKRDISPWLAPTMGFPPMSPMHHHHFRPLHVWGHPTLDQSLVHLWTKHPAHTTSQPPQPPQSTWGPPPANPSFWHHHHQRVSNGLTPGTPCFPQPIAPTVNNHSSFGSILPVCISTRFRAAPVPGIPPHHHGTGGQSGPHPLIDFHPSKESIDAAIGDVLTKPWLPLPLGLKPPSTDSVLGELQRQGVPKIPPSCA
ncbi:transcription activator GLK1 isoform X1 [Gossypium raimondii]|uniref:HTH myb-type domain-containing protein n=1 Tax=Gossypium raimondii TaxID=29730 RepID=A0A0D2VYR7_GOSRA|nr:transcription activator GLK1 isoform X1 [Gossypium raimondii]KJB77235.1 hypothetical protein B456_012G126600 [Gossypium raimondii]